MKGTPARPSPRVGPYAGEPGPGCRLAELGAAQAFGSRQSGQPGVFPGCPRLVVFGVPPASAGRHPEGRQDTFSALSSSKKLVLCPPPRVSVPVNLSLIVWPM